MFRVAWKSLLARKTRFVLTFVSVVLGVSFIAGSYIFTDSINSTFNTLFNDIYAGIDLTIRPDQDEDSEIARTFDESVYESVRNVAGISELDPDVDGDVLIIDKEGEPIISQGPPSIGFSWTPVEALNPTSVKEGNGRPPTAAGEVAIDLNTAKVHNYEIGDRINIQARGPIQEFEIVGLLSFGSTDTLAGAILTTFEFEQAQDFFDLQGQLTEIVIKIEDSADLETVQQDVIAALGDDTAVEVVTGDQQTQENLDDVSNALGFVTIFFLAFAGIAIFVATFIIQNTFRIIVSQRSKELALLRSIGATRRQIILMVVAEALLVGLIASVAGILLGVGLAQLLEIIINAAGIGLPESSVTLATRTILVSLIVGVVVTVLSALLPAIRASRIPPVQAMGDHENTAVNKSLAKRSVIGVVITAIGVLVLVLGLNDAFWNPLYLVAAGCATMFIGVSVVAPMLAKPFANFVGWPLRKAFLTSGELAIGNTKRSPRRTASTASALMIGVALVSFISILTASFKSSINDTLEESFPADLIVSSQLQNQGGPAAGVSRDFTNNLKQIDELKDISALRYSSADFFGEESFAAAGDFGSLIIGIDPSNFNEVTSLKPTNDDYAGLDISDTVYVHKSQLEDNAKIIGDTIRVGFPGGNDVNLQIVGSFEEKFDSDYLIGLATHDKYYGDENNTFLFIGINNSATIAQAKEKVQEEIESYPILQVQDTEELIKEIEGQLDALLGIIGALLGLAIIISVIGIANTLTLSISERQREIGMLRAIGMTKKQVGRTIRIESIITSLFGTVLGITMGIFFGWALMQSLQDDGLSSFSIPYIQLVSIVIIAIIAGLLAALFPSDRAARTDVLQAIATE